MLKGEELVSADETFHITRSLPHGHLQVVLQMIGQLEPTFRTSRVNYLGISIRSEHGLFVLVATQVVREFDVLLDELHNDSTSITFSGAYVRADGHQRFLGRPTLAITWGHNKDHRPDLKQLLFILTVTEDGGVLIHFRAADGNTTDVTTHRNTWEMLCQLAGRRDFRYVADCELVSTDNLRYIDQHHGHAIGT